MRAREFVNEEKEISIPKRLQEPTRGLHKFTDGQKWNSDYTLYRLGLALGLSDGKTVPKIDPESWIGRWKTAHPYTQEEVDMLKMAYRAVGAEYEDLNHGDLHSGELKSTNKTSPVPKVKRNKYGV